MGMSTLISWCCYICILYIYVENMDIFVQCMCMYSRYIYICIEADVNHIRLVLTRVVVP